ncbi:MAG: hypothetical protein ACOX8T_08145 [Bacillota bacterium]
MNRMAEQIKFDEGNEQSPVNRLNQILLERNLLLAEMEPDAMSNEDFCPFCHGQNKLCKINFPDDGKSTLFRTFLKRHQLKIALGTGSTILTG